MTDKLAVQTANELPARRYAMIASQIEIDAPEKHNNFKNMKLNDFKLTK